MIVPYAYANAPPRIIFTTRIHGALAISAAFILDSSHSERFISAGEPAPSITTMSLVLLKYSQAFVTIFIPSFTVKFS